MSKYKTKLKVQALEALDDAIAKLFEIEKPADDEDKMFFSLLQQIRDKLYDKKKKFQVEYSLNLTPAESFALRVLTKNYFKDKTKYLSNILHNMSDEIVQIYQ